MLTSCFTTGGLLSSENRTHHDTWLSSAVVAALLASALFAGVDTAWLLTLALAAGGIALSTRASTTWGLRLLWFVQKEPAASDVLFAGAAFRKLASGLPPRIKGRFHPYFLLLAFLLLSTAQIVVAKDIPRALLFNFISIYVLAIITYIFWSQEAFLERTWMRSLKLSITITALFMLALWIAKQAGIAEPLRPFFDGTRPRALFKDPNVAAPFIILWVLKLLSQFLLGKGWRLHHWLLFSILMVGVVLSFSRGALINLFIGAIFLIFVGIRRKRVVRISILTLLLAIIMMTALIISLNAGQRRFLRINDYDLGGRMAAWKSGIITLRHHPLGVGPGQFESYSIKVQTEVLGNPYITPSAHNTYLRVLVENGLPGFVLISTALFLTLAQLFRTLYLNKDRGLEIELAWCTAALLGVLGEGFFIDILHWRHLGIILGLSYYLSDKVKHASVTPWVARAYRTSPSSKSN